MIFVLAGQIYSINLNELEEIDKMQRICFHAKKTGKCNLLLHIYAASAANKTITG